MPAPTDSPEFATDAAYASDGDAWSGTPPRVDPGVAIREEGFEPGILPAEWLNHVLGVHGDWITYLDEFAGLLETDAVSQDGRLDLLETKLGGSDGSGEWVYPSARNRVLFHGLDSAVLVTDAAGAPRWSVANQWAVPLVDNAVCRFRLRLSNGSILSEVQVQISAATGRSGSARWSASVGERVYTDWSGAGAAVTTTTIGASQDDGGASGLIVISVPVSPPHTVVNAHEGDIYVTVVGPEGSLSSSDYVAGLRALFTVPGPATGA